MPKPIRLYVSTVDRLADYVGVVAMYLIFLMVGILLLDAITRNVTDIPLHWCIEAAQFTLAAYYFMGGAKTLKDGDILNIDVTVIVDGWFGDTSRMYVAGKLPRKAERLIEVTHDALMKGIEAVRPGKTFGDIGHAIQAYVEAHRMSVVRDFCGHGLGRVFHAAPNVLHYGRPGSGAKLEEGMFFTIEPMVNLGRPETKTLADDWTAVTRDKSLSAQFEHSIGVTSDGAEIFTLSPGGLFHPTYG